MNGLGYFLAFAEELEGSSPGSLAAMEGEVFSGSSSSWSSWLLLTISVAFFSNFIILVPVEFPLLLWVGVDPAGVADDPENAAPDFPVSVSK